MSKTPTRAHRALRRWQHAAGPFWLYVGSAPFLSDLEPRPAVDGAQPRRAGRISSTLSRALEAFFDGGRRLIVVDLPPVQTLRATRILNDRGFIVVPVLHRWLASPAVLESRALLEAIVEAGEQSRRPALVRGVILVLDGERGGEPGGRPGRPRAFDNRYDYSSGRFPSIDLLASQRISSVAWVSPAPLAHDLLPFARALRDSGLPMSGLTAADLARLAPDGDATAFEPDAGETAISVKLASQAPGLYRRFVQRSQRRGLLADHLAHDEPYLALSPLDLTPSDDFELRGLTETFARIFDRAARSLATDVPTLEAMGFPWVAAELLQAEHPRTPIVGRFDFVRDREQRWWLLELNADTPSGVREAIAAEEVACDLLPAAHDMLRPSAGLADALVAAFEAATSELPPGSTLGLLTNAAELEDLAQIVFTSRLIAERLAGQGVRVVVGDVDNLRATRSGLTLRGVPIQAIYRYVPFESWFGTPEFAALYDAVKRGKIVLLNGLYGLLLQHKGLLAWIWAHRDDAAFTAEERRTIADHLPPTWNVADYSAAGPEADLDVVVKQVFGREGEEVFVGSALSVDDWSRLRHRQTYVVQRRVEIATDEAVVPTSTGARMAMGHATVGGYAVAGKWAGYYTRFGGRITNARSKWLATLVWPEPGDGDPRIAGG
ncbi:MAG TPA: glutathionylspermidine synthase family protein [Chloroflexota bacterium]|nr:glutathionylspermidine synthase family protein [Chloroflexota bacterium]